VSIGIDYTNRTWKKNEAGEEYLGNVKPAYFRRREETNKAKLEKKSSKRSADLAFVDNSNIMEIAVDEWWNAPAPQQDLNDELGRGRRLKKQRKRTYATDHPFN
jgi:hypothetical protein